MTSLNQAPKKSHEQDASDGLLPEVKHLLVIALPLMGAQVAQMSMGVVDAVMAGRYSSVDLAGVALGGSLFWPTLMLMMGLLLTVGLQTLMRVYL